MSQAANQGPVVRVKPQPNVYTVLLVVAILMVAVAIYFGLDKLMSPIAEGGYGMQFEQIVKPGN